MGGKKVNIYEKLSKIQCEMKVPKTQRNEFGKYNYRNCEDILEMVKPFLKETNTIINLSDELVFIEGRFYIKATATLIDIESGEKFSTSAFAREEETKKGMDGSQITGSSSSYARKYALNGLFAIDDVKDSDTTNNHGAGENNSNKGQQKKQQTKKEPTPEEKRSRGLKYISEHKEKYEKAINKYLLGASVTGEDELSNEQVSELANSLRNLENANMKKGA